MYKIKFVENADGAYGDLPLQYGAVQQSAANFRFSGPRASLSFVAILGLKYSFKEK